MKKRVFTGILAGVLVIGALTGCGNSSDGTKNTEQSGNAQQSEDGAENVIKVAASATPHAEILEEAAGILAEQEK